LKNNSTVKVYIDTPILTLWILIRGGKIGPKKLEPRGKQCNLLLESIVNKRFQCRFLTSDWALAEVVQALRDNEIMEFFKLEGHEIAAFNRVKSQYRVQATRRKLIRHDITDFEKFLDNQQIQVVKINLDPEAVRDYCLKYSLETPDALHVLTASQHSCKYLTTVDIQLIDAKKVAGIEIVKPGTLVTKSNLLAKHV
jgi:predicted nucleic acid-binding protein